MADRPRKIPRDRRIRQIVKRSGRDRFQVIWPAARRRNHDYRRFCPQSSRGTQNVLVFAVDQTVVAQYEANLVVVQNSPALADAESKKSCQAALAHDSRKLLRYFFVETHHQPVWKIQLGEARTRAQGKRECESAFFPISDFRELMR